MSRHLHPTKSSSLSLLSLSLLSLSPSPSQSAVIGGRTRNVSARHHGTGMGDVGIFRESPHVAGTVVQDLLSQKKMRHGNKKYIKKELC